MKYGLREANQQFSKVIRAVRAGKEVVLTERGRAIAVIKPIEESSTEQAALQQMADEGLITLPSRRGRMPSPRWRAVRIKGDPLSRTIVEEREDLG